MYIQSDREMRVREVVKATDLAQAIVDEGAGHHIATIDYEREEYSVYVEIDYTLEYTLNNSFSVDNLTEPEVIVSFLDLDIHSVRCEYDDDHGCDAYTLDVENLEPMVTELLTR